MRWSRSRVTVELAGNDTDDAEIEARRRDDAGHAIYIPPYNDPEVIAGQATVGVEILEDWPEVEVIVVPIGGGGLIAGIGLWAKAVKPGLRLIGVQPSASPPMFAFFETGKTEPMPIAPTLADGVAGNIERDSITWKLCRQLVDEVVVVDEEAIADAMRWALDVPHLLLEGSAALGIAALQTGQVDGRGRPRGRRDDRAQRERRDAADRARVTPDEARARFEEASGRAPGDRRGRWRSAHRADHVRARRRHDLHRGRCQAQARHRRCAASRTSPPTRVSRCWWTDTTTDWTRLWWARADGRATRRDRWRRARACAVGASGALSAVRDGGARPGRRWSSPSSAGAGGRRPDGLGGIGLAALEGNATQGEHVLRSLTPPRSS